MSRVDPTGLSGIVRQFAAQIKARFRHLANDVSTLVAGDDVFGLTTNVLKIPGKESWHYMQTPEKLASFDSWFMSQSSYRVLSTTPSGEPWTDFWTRKGYKKGMERGYVDSRGKKLRGGHPAFFAGSKQEFLRAAMRDPKKLERIRFLATRSYEELKGVTRHMATQLNRELAYGLVNKLTPKQIAKRLVDKIKGISESRALLIARTELTASFAHAQLDAMEDLGETEVGICAEWVTKEDDKVCAGCSAMEGQLLSIDEARGLIPQHPGCRCAYINSVCSNKKARRKAVVKAATKAVKALTRTKSTKDAIKKSVWQGKRLIGKKKGI